MKDHCLDKGWYLTYSYGTLGTLFFRSKWFSFSKNCNLIFLCSLLRWPSKILIWMNMTILLQPPPPFHHPRGITSYIVCPRPAAAAVRGVVVDHDSCKWSNSLQPVDWEQLVQISIVVDRDLCFRRYTVPVTGVQKRYGATVRTKKWRKEPETEYCSTTFPVTRFPACRRASTSAGGADILDTVKCTYMMLALQLQSCMYVVTHRQTGRLVTRSDTARTANN